MTELQEIEELEREREIRKKLLLLNSREDLLSFTFSTMPTFHPADFHRNYYGMLTKFAKGDIKKMIVTVPPQHGKSEGSTRRLPAFLLGLNPELKIAIVSYNAPKAKKFNRELQRVIDMPEYEEIFPNTRLNGKNVATMAGSWLRNMEECEVVGHRGGFKSVGVGGALTGEPVDILIMDDLYKDAATAWSPIVRERVSDWYDTVAETRLHNDSQQLMVFTRWHEDDLAGKMIREQGEWSEENPDGWVICKYPAIKVGAPTEWDPRQEGEALWPERHNLHKLELVRKRNPHVFESLYQQNPKPAEGLLYDEFREYEIIPPSKRRVVKNYTDTADTGADYLCSIDYVETEEACYVLDVLYTQKPMEYTEVKQAEMMTKDNVSEANVESNNGGRGYARNVERNMRLIGNNRTKVSWFSQTQNKQVRIFTHSADVQNLIYFPMGWRKMWPDFANAITNYLKTGQNAHDDAPDTLTGIVEKRSQQRVSAARFF